MSQDLLLLLTDRFKGSALGTFVGDAMGREVEGWSPEQISACYGILNRIGQGIYSDDTEMMIGIMEALQAEPCFDPAIAARQFLTNFHPLRNYGGRIYGIMSQLQQGVSWDEVGTDSWGNGGAMRIAPIGFFFYDDADLLRENVRLCTRITHRHPQAQAGALAQAWAVGMATKKGMEGEVIDRGAFLEQIAAEVAEVDGAMAAEIRRIDGLAAGGDLEQRIKLIARTFPRDVSALGAVPAALASFLISEDFTSAVVTAVNCGGDTDTIGAMAGAIAGAYYGYAAIPAQWCEPLENGGKGRDYVAQLAEELARIKARRKGWL
jgi:poly(ADP-ribose) glycohydrolase ARH3